MLIRKMETFDSVWTNNECMTLQTIASCCQGLTIPNDIHCDQVVLDPPFENWVLAYCSVPQGHGEDTFHYWRQAVAGLTYKA
jgi:hypothetical protein